MTASMSFFLRITSVTSRLPKICSACPISASMRSVQGKSYPEAEILEAIIPHLTVSVSYTMLD